MGVAATGNVPGARGPDAGWIDSSGNLWLFGGSGLDSTGTSGALNDLWEFNPTSNQWAWMNGSDTVNGAGIYGTLGVAAAANDPGARAQGTGWTDSNHHFWLFGGEGYDSTGNFGVGLNDLWQFNTSTGQWTWMSGSNTAQALATTFAETALGIGPSGSILTSNGSIPVWSSAPTLGNSTATGTLTFAASGTNTITIMPVNPSANRTYTIPDFGGNENLTAVNGTAAIYHFSNLNYPGRSWQNHSRIRYIRPGVAQGGEARPICATYAPMTGASPAYSEPVWTNGTSPTGWYTQVVQAVQSANPLMQVMFSINVGETSLVPIDASFANDEAAVAVAYSNSTGLYDGFGSQGLEHSDIAGFTSGHCPEAGGAPDTGNNWGCMFTKYWSGSNMTYGTMGPNPTTVPLELQQIDCSNPTGVYDAQDGCFLGNTGGDTGSLVSLYAFATLNHASILELYNQDALLAYDPNFCLPAGGPPHNTCMNTAGYDWFGTNLSPTTQYNFYVNAGQGTPGCSGGSCPYASAINTAHGPH